MSGSQSVSSQQAKWWPIKGFGYVIHVSALPRGPLEHGFLGPRPGSS